MLLVSFLKGDQYSFTSGPISKRNGSKIQSQLTENISSEVKFSHQFSTVISTSEKETVKAALSCVCGGCIFWAAGAGYKSLLCCPGSCLHLHFSRGYHLQVGLLYCSCHTQGHGWGNGRIKRKLVKKSRNRTWFATVGVPHGKWRHCWSR